MRDSARSGGELGEGVLGCAGSGVPAPFAFGKQHAWEGRTTPVQLKRCLEEARARQGWLPAPASPPLGPKVHGEGGEDLVDDFAREFFLPPPPPLKKKNQPTAPNSFESSFDFSKDRV